MKLFGISIIKYYNEDDEDNSIAIEFFTKKYFRWFDMNARFKYCVYLRRNLKTEKRKVKFLWGKDDYEEEKFFYNPEE